MAHSTENENARLIVGVNAVYEAIRSSRPIDVLFVSKGERTGGVGRLMALCREKGVIIKQVDKRKLDKMCEGLNHQGVAAYAAQHEYALLDDIFAAAEKKGQAPFIIICDEIEDPHNLGAIIRTAEAAGAHGVVIPKRRSASLSAAVSKASAGAVEYVPVARVSNLAAAIDEMKQRGVWVYCADMGPKPWHEYDYTGAVALIIGSEGRGVGRLIKERCDFTASLPMNGQINSLNASVAAGILMYEVARQRAQ